MDNYGLEQEELKKMLGRELSDVESFILQYGIRAGKIMELKTQLEREKGLLKGVL